MSLSYVRNGDFYFKLAFIIERHDLHNSKMVPTCIESIIKYVNINHTT